MKDKYQIRHEELVDYLNSKDKMSNFKKLKDQISSLDANKIDANDINNGVILFTDFLNLSGGSIGNIDLYKLLQVYLGDEEKRKKINEII